VVLVHDWLVGMRGGERVLEELCRLFPNAPLYTFFHCRGSVSTEIERHPIRTSLLNRLPGVHRYYRFTLPLLPFSASRLRIEPCDLVISTSHCVARSVRAPSGARHLCICLTPMRYVWGMEEAYFGHGWRRRAYELMARPLRRWDRRTESRVDRFVAISEYVRKRIARVYGRESQVVYPPVDTDRFQPVEKPEDYFLVVSALVPYKRVDIVVEAFRARSEELWVVGDGPLLSRLRATAPRNVRFLGRVDDDALPGTVARCRALIFPTEDEFGIVPVEAQAAGRPVIALGRGGARETVVPIGSDRPPTGIWFSEQSPGAVSGAVDHFLQTESVFGPTQSRAHALSFSSKRFQSGVRRAIEELGLSTDPPGAR
jgi:glycosyltransferase involved in cell wall biosynthesis